MAWDPERRAEPGLLGVQFVVCVGAWTAIDVAVAGVVSTEGFAAAVATGVVLVAVSWALVKLGWDHGPQRPTTDRAVPAPDDPDAPGG
jgi:hypothetical protein